MLKDIDTLPQLIIEIVSKKKFFNKYFFLKSNITNSKKIGKIMQ